MYSGVYRYAKTESETVSSVNIILDAGQAMIQNLPL